MFLVGQSAVACVYYIARDWNLLCWCIALYSLFILALACFYLHESPAWLLDSKQEKRARGVLEQMAKTNGRDAGCWQKCDIWTAKDLIAVETTHVEACLIFGRIFKTKENFMKDSLLVYIWMAVMLLYYGISLGVTSIYSADPYLVFFLSTLAELVGYTCSYLSDCLGRKQTIFLFFLLASLDLALMAFLTSAPTPSLVLLALTLLAKCAVSGAENLINVYTSEMYSVSTRNTMLLLLACSSDVATMAAPQINMLQSLVWSPLPHIVYSCVAMGACVCLWFLKNDCN